MGEDLSALQTKRWSSGDKSMALYIFETSPEMATGNVWNLMRMSVNGWVESGASHQCLIEGACRGGACQSMKDNSQLHSCAAILDDGMHRCSERTTSILVAILQESWDAAVWLSQGALFYL